VSDFEHKLAVLAQELTQVAVSAANPVISRRLTEMAEEVLGLAEAERPDSPVYHSAIFFRHTGRADIASDPNANDCSSRPTQCN
jgi:hypothetical protein